MTIEEARDLDKVLSEILHLKETYGSNIADLVFVNKKFLPEKGEYYTVNLIYRAIDHEPKILITDRKIGLRTTVWGSPLLGDFLKNGGFVRIMENEEKLKRQRDEMEQMNLQKLKYDVGNSKRVFNTYWWTFGMALVGLLVSLALLIIKLFEH